MSTPCRAVFLSYASEDAPAAQRIAEALRAAGIDVWFDQSELRGGDAWDRQIRKQIHDCALFVPVISAHSDARHEGYFRREWRLAVERVGDMSERAAFLVPVVIDDTWESGADVPDRFREVQWTRLSGGETSPAFVSRIQKLLVPDAPARAGTATPSGSTVARVSKPSPHPTRASNIVLWVTSALLALGLTYLIAERLWPPQHSQASPASSKTALSPRATPSTADAFKPPAHSIAVLPFVNMSGDKEQEYFSDGLTEELIDHLARASDLKVIARTSSFQFKGRNEDVRTIASKLAVANLLEGSVRRSGKTLRITAQLVRASDGSHIWSQTYDRAVNDVFKVQNDIAEMVTRALHVALTGAAVPAADQPNVNAYAAVLKGNFFKARHTSQGIDQAISLYKEAIQIDPQYALAWARLGSAYENQVARQSVPVAEGSTRARNALERAIALDPNLIWAHYTMAGLYGNQLNWAGAAAEIERMREIDPNDQNLLPSIEADMYSVWCRFPEAIRLEQQILNRDPLNSYVWEHLARHQFDAGQFEASLGTFHRLFELSPGYGGAQAELGIVFAFAGRHAESLAAIEKESDELSRLENLPIAYWAKGDHTHSDTALHDLVTRHGSESPYAVAEVYAYRGQLREALDWLDRAAKERDPSLVDVRCDPLLESLRREPRYQALLERLHMRDEPEALKLAE